MPANLPPTYHEAEARFREASSTPEKIAALQEMLREIPKHKGTEKLQAGIKSRIAKLKQQDKKSGGTKGHSHHIPREGAGQIALVGPPNGGKSSLVCRLTHARPEVADYPFTTREALPGMMPFEDIAFQLIDLPPISTEYVEHWVYDLARAADLLWLVAESGESIDGLNSVRQLLLEKKILIHPAGGEPPADADPGVRAKPTMLVVTGLDRPGSDENVRILEELTEQPWPVVGVSATTGHGLEALKRRTYALLALVRVYTKQPGKPPDRGDPFAVPRGTTVAELARTIHKDLAEQFKFARVWGSEVFDGQSVQRDYELVEGDVVEIHLN
jgi:ribosome-interacting GTPase 1